MGYKKNTAVTGFSFAMIDASDGSAVTTGTVTGYVTIDGGSQAALTNSPTHEGNGQWSINLTAAELNGDNIGLLFTHADAIGVHFTIKTEHAAIEKAAKSLVNKAVQAKSSGAVTYYDDDGETELMTHTPTDGSSTITRVPS